MTQGVSKQIEELVGGNTFDEKHSVTGPGHIITLDTKQRDTRSADQTGVLSIVPETNIVWARYTDVEQPDQILSLRAMISLMITVNHAS